MFHQTIFFGIGWGRRLRKGPRKRAEFIFMIPSITREIYASIFHLPDGFSEHNLSHHHRWFSIYWSNDIRFVSISLTHPKNHLFSTVYFFFESERILFHELWRNKIILNFHFMPFFHFPPSEKLSEKHKRKIFSRNKSISLLRVAT